MGQLTVAAVQAEPVILDAKASLAKATDLVREAAGKGADLVLFPETFVPGYCQWAHSAPFENEAHKAAYARLARNSLRVPEDLEAVGQVAGATGTTVVLPLTERDETTPGTLYNTMAVLGPEGGYLGKHRKLVPTHHERTVYGYGDGETMQAFETTTREGGSVRFGGLLCWKNYMPVAGGMRRRLHLEVASRHSCGLPPCEPLGHGPRGAPQIRSGSIPAGHPALPGPHGRRPGGLADGHAVHRPGEPVLRALRRAPAS